MQLPVRRPRGRPKRRFIDVELDEDVEDSGRWRQPIGGKSQKKEKISRRARIQG